MDIKELIKDEELVKCLDNIKAFSDDVWKDKLLPWFTNHDTEHSEEVIYIIGLLVDQLKDEDALTEHEAFILLASAYLHDIGLQHLKLDDKIIENLNELDYMKIREQHAQKSYDIILQQVAKTTERDGYQLPKIDEQCIRCIAKVARGHANSFYSKTINNFQQNPETPHNHKVRGELLTALLLIADELDLQSKRVNFSVLSKFNLSPYSMTHWYKHHYVDYIEVMNNTVNITMMFPNDAESYPDMVERLIVSKLEEQIALVNPVLMECTHGKIHLIEKPHVTRRVDDTVVKRSMPPEAIEALKQQLEPEKLEVEDEVIDIRKIRKEHKIAGEIIDQPSEIFTGREGELNELKIVFDSSPLISIEALGGIGKTQLALRFIELHLKKDKVVWIDCNGDLKLDTVIVESGFHEILQGESKTERAKYSGYVDLMERHRLTVFMDDFHEVRDSSFEEFFKFANGKLEKSKFILLGRQHPNFKESQIVTVELDGLSNDAIGFARKYLDHFWPTFNVDEDSLKKVCVETDGHPYAIGLALDLLHYGVPTEDLLNILINVEDKRNDLSKRLLDELFNHESSTENEKEYMERLSVFRGIISPDAINHVIGSLDWPTIFNLRDKHMLKPTLVDTSKYKIHPLVREYCYKRLKSDADKLILAHSKAASFLQDTLAEDFEISIGKELFHHLYFAEDLDGMANLIDSHGSKFILGGHLNALQDMLKVIEDQNVSQHISDYLRGEIAEIRGEWDAALEYFTKAFDSSNKELSADAFIRYGEVLYHKAEYKEALGYFETAHETCRGISYEKGEARSLIDIGVIYRVFEEYSVAKKKYTEALEINKKIGNKLGISRALSHLASIYYEKNDFRHAHELENRSLKIAEELGVKVDIANILSSQGNMLAEEGHSKKALKKFNLSLSIYEEIGDKKAISTYWFNVGYVHYELVNKSKALDLFFKSLKISEEIGDKEGQSICHNRIGKLYFEDKKSAIALEHLVASYAFEKQVGVKYHDSYKEIKVIKKRLNRYEFEKLAKEAISKLPEYLKEYVTFEEIAAMQPDKKQELTDNVSSKIGRNDPCPCESGKKYKKCCGKN